MTLYRQDGEILYVLTMALIVGLDQTLPRTGGRFTIASLTAGLHPLFPPNLSPLARERLVERAIEYAYLRARGISTPGWIGLSLIDCVLVCPRHPEARPLPDFFLLPPQPGSDEVAPEQ